MSSGEWDMVIYGSVVIGLLGLSVRLVGMERFHRLFFCVFFPVSIQLILFWLAYVLSVEVFWLGMGVIALALVVVPITLIKTVDLALKQVERETFSLAISSMFIAAFIPLVITLLALVSNY